MKLKGCVFCSGSADWTKETIPGDDRETFKITCTDCGYALSGFCKKSEAFDEWNGMEINADSRLFCESTHAGA